MYNNVISTYNAVTSANKIIQYDQMRLQFIIVLAKFIMTLAREKNLKNENVIIENKEQNNIGSNTRLLKTNGTKYISRYLILFLSRLGIDKKKYLYRKYVLYLYKIPPRVSEDCFVTRTLHNNVGICEELCWEKARWQEERSL